MNADTLRKAVAPAIAGIAGLSVGGVVGYIVANRRARKAFLHLVEESEQYAYEQRVRDYSRNPLDEEEDDAVREQLYEAHPGIVLAPEEKLHDITKPDARIPYYKVIPNNAERFIENPDDPRTIVEAKLAGLTLGPGPNAFGGTVELVDLADAMITKNAFKDNPVYDVDEDDDWNWEAELSMRSDKTIYVITRDEFDEDNLGYRQSTVNWYEGDRMLSDENGDAIYNWTSHIGSELPFGHGSGDENVLFIRNENLRWEYCVTRDPGRFDQEVEGHAIELDFEEKDFKHSRQPLKMRKE